VLYQVKQLNHILLK